MIRLEQVSKLYRTERIETVALHNVNLTIEEGELVSIMGPSGCGKSTLLHLMGLLDEPSQGEVEIDGETIDRRRRSDRELARLRNERVGFIFQQFHLIPDLSVADNVEIPLLYRKLSGKERRSLALAALDRVGLSSRTRHFPTQLSGGQQQRVAIARALAQNAKVILADEPVASLDPESSATVLESLRVAAAAGVAVIASLHQVHLATHYADRIIALRGGAVLQDAPTATFDPPAFAQIYDRTGERQVARSG